MNTFKTMLRDVTLADWIRMGEHSVRTPNVVYRVHYGDDQVVYCVSPNGGGAYYYSTQEQAEQSLEKE